MIKMQYTTLLTLPSALLNKGAQKAAPQNSPSPNNVRPGTLNDSLEELGEMFSEKAEGTHKTKERHALRRNQFRGRQAVNKIDELNQLFALFDGNDTERALEQLERLSYLLRQSPAPDTDTILEETGGDAARTDHLLRVLEQQASQLGDTALAGQANAHRQQLAQTHGDIIRAGNNTAQAIGEHTNDPQQKQWLRNLYYDSIVQKQSAIVMLDLLLEKIEPRSLISTLNTLRRALAADFAALAPSISTNTLGRIQRGLRDAARINQMLAESNTFLQRMRTKLPELSMKTLPLTRRILNISHNGAYQSDFHQLAQDVVGDNAQHLPLFFSGLFPVLNKLPASLWPEPDNRQDALSLLRTLITEVSETEQQQLRNHNGQT